MATRTAVYEARFGQSASETRANVPQYRIAMVRERSVAVPRRITCANHVYEACLPIFAEADREVFLVLCVDAQLKLTAIHVASVGTLDATMAHPREVFKPAVLMSASAIFVAHNHPSGDPRPSAADRESAERLRMCGVFLGIPVLDALVCGDGEYFSFARAGRWQQKGVGDER